MGVPLDIFSLYRLWDEGAGCNHYLLLRVGQPAFSNADQGEYDYAVEVADRKRSALIESYESEGLAAECAGHHAVNLIGELQASPAGGELSEGDGGFHVDLWVAQTRFGHPWVVMGTAESEEAFWREVGQDEELAGLGASRPARKERVFFLAERVDETRRGR